MSDSYLTRLDFGDGTPEEVVSDVAEAINKADNGLSAELPGFDFGNEHLKLYEQ